MPASIPADIIETMTDAELHLHALTTLRHELGLEGFVRFLQMNPGVSRDYTAERHLWLGHLTVEDILRESRAADGQTHA